MSARDPNIPHPTDNNTTTRSTTGSAIDSKADSATGLKTPSKNAVIIIKGQDLPAPMEVGFTKEGIVFDKVQNQIDDFVVDFTTILNDNRIDYVIVSGYVALLFGRSRKVQNCVSHDS